MQESEIKLKQTKQVLFVLWSALLFSNFTLLYVSYAFIFNNPKEIANQLALNIIIGLSGVALLASRFSYLKANMIVSSVNRIEENMQQKLTRAFVFYILAWTLGESISVFAIIYGTLGQYKHYEHAYYLFFAAIALHLFQRPKVS